MSKLVVSHNSQPKLRIDVGLPVRRGRGRFMKTFPFSRLKFLMTLETRRFYQMFRWRPIWITFNYQCRSVGFIASLRLFMDEVVSSWKCELKLHRTATVELRRWKFSSATQRRSFRVSTHFDRILSCLPFDVRMSEHIFCVCVWATTFVAQTKWFIFPFFSLFIHLQRVFDVFCCSRRTGFIVQFMPPDSRKCCPDTRSFDDCDALLQTKRFNDTKHLKLNNLFSTQTFSDWMGKINPHSAWIRLYEYRVTTQIPRVIEPKNARLSTLTPLNSVKQTHSIAVVDRWMVASVSTVYGKQSTNAIHTLPTFSIHLCNRIPRQMKRFTARSNNYANAHCEQKPCATLFHTPKTVVVSEHSQYRLRRKKSERPSIVIRVTLTFPDSIVKLLVLRTIDWLNRLASTIVRWLVTSVNYSDDKLLFTNDGSSLVAIAKIDISCSISLAFVICYQQTSSCQSQTNRRYHSAIHGNVDWSFEAIDAQAIHESTKVSFCIFFTNANAIRKRIPFARNATIIFSLSISVSLYTIPLGCVAT